MVQLRDAAGPLAVALKSGNFGGPDFFADALRLMQQGGHFGKIVVEFG